MLQSPVPRLGPLTPSRPQPMMPQACVSRQRYLPQWVLPTQPASCDGRAQAGREEPVALSAASRSLTKEGPASSDSRAPACSGSREANCWPRGAFLKISAAAGWAACTGECTVHAPRSNLRAAHQQAPGQTLPAPHLPGARPPCCSTAWRPGRGHVPPPPPAAHPPIRRLQWHPGSAAGSGTPTSGRPADGAREVAREPALSWMGGFFSYHRLGPQHAGTTA